MTIKIFKSLPKEVYVACSGGVDSVALALYLKNAGKDVHLVYYYHPEDSNAEAEFEWLVAFSKEYRFKELHYTKEVFVSREGGSREMWWRENRLRWFDTFGVVLTGHHLDDAVEWYLMTTFTGEPHYMKYASKNTLKPFLLNKKADIVDWVKQKHPELTWYTDATNNDAHFNRRNYVRKYIIPNALQVNPGLYKTIKNKLIEKN